MERDELATVTGHGSYRRIEVRRVVDAPIRKVWHAITNADEVRHWWDAGTIDAREGGRVQLGEGESPDSELLPLDGRVKVCLPPHVFEFTWNEAYEPAEGLVRFDLVELKGDRTRITLVNIVPARNAVPATAGWHQLVERIGQYVKTDEPVAVPEDGSRFRELKSMYEAVVGQERTSV